jgi:hypothetical protein
MTTRTVRARKTYSGNTGFLFLANAGVISRAMRASNEQRRAVIRASISDAAIILDVSGLLRRQLVVHLIYARLLRMVQGMLCPLKDFQFD